MKMIDRESFSTVLADLEQSYHSKYYAMYSSIYGGIVTDPALMLLPIDDHMVHRGDGLFETFKCVNGSIYNMDAHMSRLVQSASLVEYEMVFSIEELKELVTETVRAGAHKNCTIRIFLSRGPGSFGVNPYDCPSQQLYIIVHNLSDLFMDVHPEGATAVSSKVAMKPAFFAEIKSCNYLSNVLMKKEAVDAGVNYVCAFDSKDNLTEGATENVGMVSEDGVLLFPRLEGILSGTTMLRALELAVALKESGVIKDAVHRDISREMMNSAAEILIVGTTNNLVAVTEFDGKPVADGKPGPVWCELGKLLSDDILSNKVLQTLVFE